MGALRQAGVLEGVDDIAEDRALGAAGGAHFLRLPGFEIGLRRRAHDDDAEVGVVIDAGDLVVVF